MQKTCALLTLLALCALTAQGVAVQDPQLKTNEDASIPAAEGAETQVDADESSASLQYDDTELPAAELYHSADDARPGRDCLVTFDGIERGVLRSRWWGVSQCCADQKDCTTVAPEPIDKYNEFRPMWLDSTNTCILLAEDIPRYRLPNHNSAELCIPDEAIQPRNVGYNLAWIGKEDEGPCVLAQNKTAHYVIPGVNYTTCCHTDACRATQLNSTNMTEHHIEGVSSIGWQSNICLFVSNEDKYGYIRNVNKEQCPSSQAILDDYVQDHPYPNYTKR